jgi:hypothetical protein
VGGPAAILSRYMRNCSWAAKASDSGHVPSSEDVNGFGVGDELYSCEFGLNLPAAAAPSSYSLAGWGAPAVSRPLCADAAPKPEAEIAIDPRSRVHFTLS